MSRARKRPFDFTVAMRALRIAVKRYPKAAMFELADAGYLPEVSSLVDVPADRRD